MGQVRLKFLVQWQWNVSGDPFNARVYNAKRFKSSIISFF